MTRRIIHIDESPFRFEQWRRHLPNWLQRFLPSGGGSHEDHHGKGMFGFTVFLLSESLIFLSFIFTYIALRLTHSINWLPPGVSGPELSTFVIINTVVLLSSSFAIQPAENALKRGRLKKFRLLWLMTICMGTYFLISQVIEWSKLDFGLSTGLVGSTFYVLTGFHGLHVVVVGGGATGVEMTATLADFLPHWYSALGGNSDEIRVILLNHGQKILDGDINDPLRPIAEKELQKRTIPIEMLTGAEATAIRPNAVEYKHNQQIQTLATQTTVWAAGTSIHPLIQDLPIPKEHRDRHNRPLVTPTMQLLDFPEVFAGGDCAAVQNSSLPPTAQVAYQQGANIASNLKALALGEELKHKKVNIRGTLLKLGINDAAANLFNVFEVAGEPAHLIRHGTYLTLLPTPIHDFKATTEWVDEEIFHQHLYPQDVGKKVAQAVEIVGAGVIGVLVARKLLKMLGDEEKRG